MPAAGPNETRFAKLSPVETVVDLEGELDRLDAVERGVDRPDVFACRRLGIMRLEDIGGGLLAGAFELEDQLSPLRSSMAGKRCQYSMTADQGG